MDTTPVRSAWPSSLPARGALPVLAILLAAMPLARSQAAEGCSLADGAAWSRYRSRHFDIDLAGTEASPAAVVKAFEDLRAAVLGALISEPVEIPGRVRVIVLPRRADLVDYTGNTGIVGLFWVSRLGEPTVLVSADQIDDVPLVVAHELTHYVSTYLFPSQPYWFSEGLAQFVEGVARVDGDGKRWAGSDPASGWMAGSIKLTRTEQLVGQGSASGLYDDPFVSAWILYRFLWNERGLQLMRFQERLMEGDAPLEAWGKAFPEWDVGSGRFRILNNELNHHKNAGRGARVEVKLGEVERSFTKVPVSNGDLHLSLLALRLEQVNTLLHERTRRLALEEAAREDPGHPVVGLELARLRGEPLLPAARALAAGRPEDGRGWYMLGLEASDPKEREAALRKAVAAWPEGAFARAALAAHLTATGRAREALALADQAADLAPWSPQVVATLAAVAADLGKCREALVLQERAVAVAARREVGSVGANVTALRSQLTTVHQRCPDRE